MKVGDKVKVITSGGGFPPEKVGGEYTILKIVEKGYFNETGVLLEGYKNMCAQGMVGKSCLKVIKPGEPNYEIY